MKNSFYAVFILIFLLGCEEYNLPQTDLTKRYQFDVEISSSVYPQLGEDTPIEIPYDLPSANPVKTPLELNVKITLKDYLEQVVTSVNGETYSGKNISFSLSNGEIIDGNKIKDNIVFTNGIAEITIQIKHTYDEVALIVEDISIDSVGISNKMMHFKNITIEDIQKPIPPEIYGKAAFLDIFVHITSPVLTENIADDEIGKSIYVVAVSATGMYLLDLSQDKYKCETFNSATNTWEQNPNFEGYGTLYIYSRNAPENYSGDSSTGVGEEYFKRVRAGQRLEWFSGNLSEYLEMTELSFPLWNISIDEQRLDDSILESRMSKIPVCKINSEWFPTGRSDQTAIKRLERYESGLVRVENVTIGEYDPLYYQWEIKSPTGTMLVISRDNAPDFDPVANKGKKIKSLKGVLHQIYGELWVINVRNMDDIVLE